MPGFNGTGPLGQGPMTGGGRGYCAVPFSSTTGRFFPFRRAFLGRGRGHGYRNMFYATGLTGLQRASMGYPAFAEGGFAATPLSTKDQTEILREEAKLLEQQLEDIKQRIRLHENKQGQKTE